jgi:hypothetical protein
MSIGSEDMSNVDDGIYTFLLRILATIIREIPTSNNAMLVSNWKTIYCLLKLQPIPYYINYA